MAANPTIYCLEEITDYSEFERLCSDLMSRQGFTSIEPLGGFHDKGRDAIHVNKTDSNVTIFAYSVREDWRAKLAEDAKKIKDHGHKCDRLIFVTTARFSATERDEACETLQNEFGWVLDLYGLERLRILLEVNHTDIRAAHPQIFTPGFFSSPDLSVNSRDHLFISYAPEEKALAEWLTQKLTAEGYKVWCESFKLLGGENYPENVDEAIKRHSFRMIALYSRSSLSNAEVTRQRGIAMSIDDPADFILPLIVDDVTSKDVDRKTAQLQFIGFQNWADGLEQLLKKLMQIAAPKQLGNGKTIAAESFLRKNFLSENSEVLITNFLRFKQIPEKVLHFYTNSNIEGRHVGRLGAEWAFKYIKPGTFLSFNAPPQEAIEQLQLEKVDEYEWKKDKTINGILTGNLISELLRRSLEVKCFEKGLKYYRDGKRSWIYFPQGLVQGDRIKYVRPDGKQSRVGVTGKRTYWTPRISDEYHYHLAPSFQIKQNMFDDFSVAVRLRIYITNTQGYMLQPRPSLSRRKRLCKDWWNDEWLNRILAVCQYLGDDGLITIGQEEVEQVILAANPVSISAPIGVNEAILGNEAKEERDELLNSAPEDLEETEEAYA